MYNTTTNQNYDTRSKKQKRWGGGHQKQTPFILALHLPFLPHKKVRKKKTQSSIFIFHYICTLFVFISIVHYILYLWESQWSCHAKKYKSESLYAHKNVRNSRTTTTTTTSTVAFYFTWNGSFLSQWILLPLQLYYCLKIRIVCCLKSTCSLKN